MSRISHIFSWHESSSAQPHAKALKRLNKMNRLIVVRMDNSSMF